MEIIDLGSDHTAHFYAYGATAQAGIAVEHHTRTGVPCESGALFKIPATDPLGGPRVTVESMEPLTIREPIECEMCGDTGRIVNGEWIKVAR